MAVLKVLEILADSDKGFEDAAKKAVKKASQSVKNIKSCYINEQSCVVKGDDITSYRVNCKITFEVD